MRKKIILSEKVQKLEPYKASHTIKELSRKKDQKIYKLDWNESTIPPSPKVFQAIQDYLKNEGRLNWYADTECNELRDMLADYTKLSKNNILVTNGSDAGLELIARTYLNEEDEVIIPSPTYTNPHVYFKSCLKNHDQMKEVFFESPFKKDFKKILNSITSKTKLMYIVNPNNPTGITYSNKELKQIANQLEGILIIDEAYHEFYGKSATNLIESYDNIIVTRSFSKAFGLAGLRIGYILTCEENILQLKRLHNPKSVNSLGQVAAVSALKDLEYMWSFVKEVKKSKKLLKKELEKLGLEVYSTPGNFILIKVDNPRSFDERLSEKGVYIRDRSNIPQLQGFVRLSVGTFEQSKDILSIIKKVL